MPTSQQELLPTPIHLKDYQPSAYVIDDVTLSIDLYEEMTIVHASMNIRRNPDVHHAIQPLVLQGEDLILMDIHLNKKTLEKEAYKLTPSLLIIPDVPENFYLDTITKIKPQKNTELSGLYRASDYYCTQCEAEGFRRITYFLDRPDILARFRTTITAEEARYPILLSNGNLIASGKTKDGRHFATWDDPFKKPSYLFALVAGNFDILEDVFTTISNKKIALRIYVNKGEKEKARYAMHALKTAMRWDETAYGREYDLSIYMIVATHDFNMGAMENKGLNIFNAKYILAQPTFATDNDFINILGVVGHEYFHNWTGNRITCRDWFQLSLKEGLTIFREQCFLEETVSPLRTRISDVTYLREVQFPEDQGPLAHSVYPQSYIEINNFYTATIYNKGAEILRMLQIILGKALFIKGMSAYFERYDGRAITIDDYLSIMEEITGISLLQFREWYIQIGTPILKIEEDYNPSQQCYTLTIQQKNIFNHQKDNAPPLHIPIRLSLFKKDGTPIVFSDLTQHMSFGEKKTEVILHLTEKRQLFQFNGIHEQPVPSLLRYFSAPVKLNFNYQNHDLLFLIKHETDPFNRFEACTRYFLNVIQHLLSDHQKEKTLKLPDALLELVKDILVEPIHDDFLKSELLHLPSEILIGEEMAVIDVEGIHMVRTFIMTALADALRPIFLNLYEENNIPYSDTFVLKDASKRALKNKCFSYLMHVSDRSFTEAFGTQQFTKALSVNMTDSLAALSELIHLPHLSTAKEKALTQFYTTWKTHPLVVNQWLAVQAKSNAEGTLDQVKKLTNHEAFQLCNPNKVYALLGTFSQHNRLYFHSKDGEGYAFLREMILQLDKINPIVAARIIQPLTQWQRYDTARQTLMQLNLSAILESGPISKDLYELVHKSLLL